MSSSAVRAVSDSSSGTSSQSPQARAANWTTRRTGSWKLDAGSCHNRKYAPRSTASHVRCAACACRSPTAATCGASTACRSRSTSWLPRESMLTFEEIGALVDAFTPLGVDRVRLTGGEPLLRRDLPVLIGLLAARPRDPRPGADDQRRAARDAGARRCAPPGSTGSPSASTRCAATASRRSTRCDELARRARRHRRRGRRGLRVAQARHRRHPRRQRRRAGRPARVRRGSGAEVRFIEYMDVGGATHWRRDAVRPAPGDARAPRGALRPDHAARRGASAPAERFLLPDGTTFGIIASTTEPFCATCDRSRLTADGVWLLCLYARGGTDLRRPLRAGPRARNCSA